MTLPQVRLGGVLGEALEANRAGRLAHFITDETSPAIELFDPASTRNNTSGDWYGEHAGKWLYAAAKAAVRTHDAALLARVRRVADHLVALQADDGYLGTYAPERRFMHPQPPKPVSWDGAPCARTWDIWTHSYLILGLLEVHRHCPEPRYLSAARRIGDLCWRTLTDGGIAITELGNHFGMSATVLMDPAVELHFATGEARYLELAELILQQANDEPGLALLDRALAGADASEIATGKAYQLAWNLVGLAKLHKATGNPSYKEAVDRLWDAIRAHHLTLGGGPWGGVAHRSREVFNPAGVFSPHGYVETCSTLAWIQLNRELLAISGQARYAEEIERSAYNDLLGAQAPNGEDWCYYVFPNGKRTHTTYWRCCKSSGAMALEELPGIAYTLTAADGVAINLLGAGSATLELPHAGTVAVEQFTRYPFDGHIHVRITPQHASRFAVSIRVPAWAAGATLRLPDGAAMAAIVPGDYAVIERTWAPGDSLELELPMPPRLQRMLSSNVQESLAPDATVVRQEVMHYDYVAILRGPLVYACGLIDGFKTEETLRLPDASPDACLAISDDASAEDGPTILLTPGNRAPIPFVPYYRAGGRQDGGWRLTWMPIAPADAGATGCD